MSYNKPLKLLVLALIASLGIHVNLDCLLVLRGINELATKELLLYRWRSSAMSSIVFSCEGSFACFKI